MPEIDHPLELTEAESLRRQLEWELNLDERRLESNAWYHGPISRPHAEELLKNEGEFLIRDSSSGLAGDLVLSCFWRGTHLHFKIDRVIIQPNTVYESRQYRLEDEPFQSIPDLVRFYVGNSKPLTIASGAKISIPINRSYPISYYSSTSSSAKNFHRPISSSPAGSNIYSGQTSTLGRIRMALPTSRESWTQSLPRSTTSSSHMKRHPSESALEGVAVNPPPKPSRVPSFKLPEYSKRVMQTKTIETSNLSQESSSVNSDETIDGEDGDVLSQLPNRSNTQPRPLKLKGQRPLSETRNSFLETSNDEMSNSDNVFNEDFRWQENAKLLLSEENWMSNVPSLYNNLQNFQTPLLFNGENKPLEMNTLELMSHLLETYPPKRLALHLLHDDLDHFGGVGNPVPENTHFMYANYFRSVGSSTGIELSFLIFGKQYRQDILERTNCFRLFVACTILTCPTTQDRCAMLNKWIETAIESKTAFGNMFGYVNIMYGLCMPQVQRLKATWNLLRQHHTSNAHTFETQLRPQRKTVMPHPPNTTVPDLLAAILLSESSLETFLNEEGVSIARLSLNLPNMGNDFGLDLFASHLSLIRSWSLNLPLYQRNGRKAIEKAPFDQLLLDLFRTEFHLKFLWGSRGARNNTQQNRYDKFEEVLSTLSKVREPEGV